MLRLFFLLTLFISSFWTQAFSQSKDALKDSIQTIHQKLANSSTDEERLTLAQSAYQLSIQLDVDSITLKSGRQLSLARLNVDDYSNFKKLNQNNVALALKLNDSVNLAYSYHDLAWYYDINYRYDSAYYFYYNAQKLYNTLQDTYNESGVFLNMAVIQEDQKDYIGAEKNAINGVRLAEQLPRTDANIITEWSLYNMLAIISLKLKNYDQSLTYYQKTLDLANQMSREYYYYTLNAKNNIGDLYNTKGEYEKALPIFEQILDERDILLIDMDLYIVALVNLARTKVLLNSDQSSEIQALFDKALKASDSIGSDIGRSRTLAYLSEFYSKQGKLDSALIAEREIYSITKELGATQLMLNALKRLSQLDTLQTKRNYLEEYISVSDSLLDNERAARNKFARIEFETEQLKEEKEKADRERLIFLTSSIALLVTLILIYVIISQRIKNKELAFERQQQEANEEIYNLMLAQQDKMDEGRTAEKKRISEELHDGILSRLFGTRFSLDSLNKQSDDTAIKKREQYIQELQAIEQEIRKISHDLNADFVGGSSFSDILETLVETQTAAYQLKYSLKEKDDIDWDELDNKTKIHVYRILQESMQNVYKHAEATKIDISFESKNNVILITVQDNGKGFNTNKARKGIGLKNFDSRARDLGGKVEIFSNLNQGTKVQIHIPTAN